MFQKRQGVEFVCGIARSKHAIILPCAHKTADSSFETQGRHHQGSNTEAYKCPVPKWTFIHFNRLGRIEPQSHHFTLHPSAPCPLKTINHNRWTFVIIYKYLKGCYSTQNLPPFPILLSVQKKAEVSYLIFSLPTESRKRPDCTYVIQVELNIPNKNTNLVEDKRTTDLKQIWAQILANSNPGSTFPVSWPESTPRSEKISHSQLLRL